VELLVRGTGLPGISATLQTLPYDRYIPQTRPPDWDQPRELLTLQYSDEAPITGTPVPDTLRPVVPIPVEDAVATRLVVMSQGFLNGRPADLARVDLTSELGAVEIWEIENIVGMDHPFHLHGFQFQVIDRNGVPEPFLSWK